MRRSYLSNGKSEGYKSYRTVAELAEFLGVSPRTIERWHRESKIPPPAHVTKAGWKLWSNQQAWDILQRRIK